MRMLMLALAALPGTAFAGDSDPVRTKPTRIPTLKAEGCENTRQQWAKRAAAPLRLRTLEQEPAADQYLGVLHLENGCEKPIKIRENIGGGPDAER
jgi:hypothetical protein